MNATRLEYPPELLEFAAGRQIITFSQLAMFRSCRRKAQWRYEENLVPAEPPDEKLRFGRLMHELHEAVARGEGLQKALDEAATTREAVIAEETLHAWTAYCTEQGQGAYRQEAAEKLVWAEIREPHSNQPSRGFVLAGKVDRLLRAPDGTLAIQERKTTSAIDAGYLEKLWCDLQSHLYARMVGARWIVYDIAERCQLKMKEAETDEEFFQRRAELLAKSKTGKTSAKQGMGETEEQFRARVIEWLEKKNRFHRETILVTPERLKQIDEEIWDLVHAYAQAQRKGNWYQNTGMCHLYNSTCPYWRLCLAGVRDSSDPIVESSFIRRSAHEELLLEVSDRLPF